MKWQQQVDDAQYNELVKIAKERHITLQELIRSVVIPEWIRYWELKN